MARALGVDPGTGSFDLVVVDGEHVVWEKSIPTAEVARNPRVLVEAIREAGPVDIIAGPSGYGTPVVCNEDIVDPEQFALEILLLTPREQLRAGLEKGHVGIAVYKALADVVVELWRERLPVCYIPGVVHLPTVPRWRKLNKIDMGTADKMAVTVLAVYDYARTHGVDYSEATFILVEMGYGYNAVIAVENGKIVDGLGGTLVSPGFLTIGAVDAEVAVAGGCWERSDVFEGGVASICGTAELDRALAMSGRCKEAFQALYEGVEKSVRAMLASVKPREIIVSGRLTRIREVYEEVSRRLEKIAPVRRLGFLEGARNAKEAGQGYAIVGEGLVGGVFSRLVRHMGIPEARGTVMDWIVHPRLRKARARLRRAYLETVVPGKAVEILWEPDIAP
ncbi:DUF1464 family protein [Hyperthermus butylicus]|uniref:Conserved archaeal protein n=1 Tax=Hyperthermus butylicus (strain DSM 5456 / JCM 9403 / PLM1-5) TaxID=415426 RepID=A2BKW0_HYPBU|nr:DUF1464 family protein [Hyperthermus butylicus]ABM80621.1 conserved archaeal protein [Hyperthermus butylicus DSM 5456]